MPEADYPTDTVDRLRLAVTRLSRRLRQESGTATALTPSRFSALATIESEGPLRLSALARAERVSKSSITRIVGSLEDLECVELIADPHDGRSTLVGITAAGRAVLASTSEKADAFLSRRIAEFTPAEQLTVQAAVLLLEQIAARRRG